jgi:hypothetical protein
MAQGATGAFYQNRYFLPAGSPQTDRMTLPDTLDSSLRAAAILLQTCVIFFALFSAPPLFFGKLAQGLYGQTF